jgi:hypothetical protein
VATYAGMEYTAAHGEKLLYENLFGVPHEYMTEGVPSGTYAFVVDANQRDPYATYELLERMEWTQVEMHRATSEFTANGKTYPEGSYVILMKQPRGNWAHQVLGSDRYPEVRDCDTCPVYLPYAEATTSLPLELGVSVDEIADPFEADLEPVDSIEVPEVTMPEAPAEGGAYLVRPESYGTIQIVSALQADNIPTFRVAEEFTDAGVTYPAGTYVVPATPQARGTLEAASTEVGLPVAATDTPPAAPGLQLKPGTRVGLLRGIGNMPGGWDMWLFDQYGINYKVVRAQDFGHKSLNQLYDTIVISSGVDKEDIVEGLDPAEYSEKYSWAYGVGNKGWNKLRQFVNRGGTLLAVGESSETAQELLNLPITNVLPGDEEEFVSSGSLLRNEFDPSNPVAWGQPEEWPVWFYDTAAFEVSDPNADVVASYPDSDILASGYLHGEEHIAGTANVVSFDIGKGQAVVYGSEVTFRTLPREQFTLLYNAIYNGPAEEVEASQLRQLQSQFGR